MNYLLGLFSEHYFVILVSIFFSIFLGLIIFGLSYILAVQNPDSEKISAYECGFEPFEDARNKFDVRFYVVAILFIVFDIEVLYLFPWSISLYAISFQGFWVMILFLLILTLGFFYEIVKKALDW